MVALCCLSADQHRCCDIDAVVVWAFGKYTSQRLWSDVMSRVSKKVLWASLSSMAVIFSMVFVVLWFQQTPHQSDVIARAVPELGPNAHVLLPLLEGATVVAPNHPHNPSEVFSEDKHTLIRRTRSFTVSTNSLGLRNRELAKIASRTRILCLGDSVTFGWGVESDESYPERLAQLIAAEVVNAGVPAMEPEHLVGYSRTLASINPDIVLIAMRPNWMVPQSAVADFARVVRVVQRVFVGAKIAVLLPPLSTFDPRGRAQSAREVRELSQQINEIPLLDLTPIFDQKMPQEGVELRVSGNEQLVVSRKDQQVLVRAAAPGGKQLAGPVRSLAVEVTQLFEEDASIKEPLFFDGGHPDALGFKVFADAVRSWLVELAWVSEKAKQSNPKN